MVPTEVVAYAPQQSIINWLGVAIDGVLFIAIVVVAILLSIYIVYLVHDTTRRKKRAKRVLELVSIPKDNEIEIKAAEQLFANLAGIGNHSFKNKFFGEYDYISFEIVGLPETIRFYVSMPNGLVNLVNKQINAAYPEAEILIQNQEYKIFSEESTNIEFAELKLAKKDYLPIREYEDMKVDTISAITTSLSGLLPHEGAAMQLIISPSDGKWVKKGKAKVKDMQKTGDEKNPKPQTDTKQVEAINKKMSKLGYNFCIRLVATSPSADNAKKILKSLVESFKQFEDPGANKFTKRKLRWYEKQDFIIAFKHRHLPLFRFLPNSHLSVLNTSELASIFHLPNKNVNVPNLHWLSSKRAPVPEGVATEGLYIGDGVYRGIIKRVALLKEDRTRHVYIVGRTGVGKSTLLEKMILQDISNGEGVIFIDPHGDSAENIIYRIPPERAEDVIYFDPGDTERPIGFNILDNETELEQHQIASAFYALLEKLFDPNKTGITGPQLERVVRNALLTAMARPGSTLIEVLKLILLDQAYLNEMLKYLKDDVVRSYWTEQIAKTSDYHKSETLGYFTSKFDRFVTNKTMRNILGQSKSAFNFSDIMNNRKILIMNLSKGKLGEQDSQFLGLILIPKILSAAYTRAKLPIEERKDCYLYVDEFQNFATDDFMKIMSEARKYRLNLTVANQYMSQMTDQIRQAVFGNVGSLVSFKVGAADAEILEKEFSPTFKQQDLLNLENRNCYVKMIAKGETIPAFSLDTTWKIPEPNISLGDSIKKLSSVRYGRSIADVEKEMEDRRKSILEGGKEAPSTKKNPFDGFNF